MRAAIDGDIVLYSVCFAAKDDPFEYAAHSAKKMCTELMRCLSVSGAELYLTGKGNYREALGTEAFPYKGNRVSEKPPHYAELKQWMIDKLGAELVEGEEADDRLGIDGYAGTHIVCTLDKDLMGVPSWNYNWRTKELRQISPEDADRFFYKQLLTGDSTDNIPGLHKRLGKKVMKRVWEPLSEMYNPEEMYAYVHSVYSAAYEEVGMCLDDRDEVLTDWLTRQGQQLWIRRTEGEVWLPPSVA